MEGVISIITSRTIFTALALLIVARLFWMLEPGQAIAGSIGVVVIGTMVWFTDIWTDYILPFGFWETKASDYGSPRNSMGALVILAWVLLAVLGYATLELK